jgi:RimJ/RimL family protein N-acetyltransferase
VIRLEDKPIGLINLADLDLKNLRTSFGFYIGDREYWNIGGMVLPYFYNYVFDNFPVNKIMAEVFKDNENIIKIHYLHGFCYIGTLRNHIYKNHKQHDIIALELYRDLWETGRFRPYQAKFC